VPPAPIGESTEPSLYTTTSDTGNLLRKSAAASGWLGLEREQPSMKVVTVKFVRAQGGVAGLQISDSLGLWIFCDERKDYQDGLFSAGMHLTRS